MPLVINVLRVAGMEARQYPQTFQEQQRELCILAEFIKEKESWLDGALDQLEWTREGIMNGVRVCRGLRTWERHC